MTQATLTPETKATETQNTPCEAKSNLPAKSTKRVVVPRYQIRNQDNGFELTAYLPGVAPENLSLDLEDRLMTLKGHSEELYFEGFRRAYGEFTPVDFEANFRISDEIDVNNIEASLVNGKLTVNLPKSAKVRHSISVN